MAFLRGLAAAVFAAGASSVTFAACGGNSDAEHGVSDREQVQAAVTDFFRDAAAEDVEALCRSLTPVGRAYAISTRITVVGRQPAPATEQECRDDGASAVTGSMDLRIVVQRDALRVTRIELEGDRATATVKAFALSAEQSLRRTADAWKIERFQLPVRE